MTETAIKTHLVLNQDFGASKASPPADGGRPAPLTVLMLRADHLVPSATYELLEGSLRYYPLELEDLLMSDVLRAHYKCHAKDQTVYTRFDYKGLEKQIRDLRLHG